MWKHRALFSCQELLRGDTLPPENKLSSYLVLLCPFSAVFLSPNLYPDQQSGMQLSPVWTFRPKHHCRVFSLLSKKGFTALTLTILDTSQPHALLVILFSPQMLRGSTVTGLQKQCCSVEDHWDLPVGEKISFPLLPGVGASCTASLFEAGILSSVCLH